jgi:hypothetical protein
MFIKISDFPRKSKRDKLEKQPATAYESQHGDRALEHHVIIRDDLFVLHLDSSQTDQIEDFSPTDKGENSKCLVCCDILGRQGAHNAVRELLMTLKLCVSAECIAHTCASLKSKSFDTQPESHGTLSL